VREKRDKALGRRFHAGKKLSEKRDKREKTYSSGYSFSVSVSAVCYCWTANQRVERRPLVCSV
jgi:hypothetical protein